MIEYVDLLYSIAKTLNDNYPKATIRINKKKSEKEIENGLFYITISPLKSSTSFELRKKLLNIYIEYVEEVKTQESSLKMQQELEELFDENIVVSGVYSKHKRERYLPISNKTISDNEDNITLSFTLNYFDAKAEYVPENPDATYDELMKILKLNIVSS